MMMKVQSKMKQFIVIMCCLMPLVSYSEDGHHHEAEAHVHGVATLNWILEGPELHIALQSPMMDLLGFEHRPESDDEKQLFAEMIAKLKNMTKVIDLIGGECELVTANIVNPSQEEMAHEGEKSTLSHEASHSEVTAEYAFLCQEPSQLEAMDINLFNTFSGFKVINAQWIADGKQGGIRLNHHQQLIKVR
jgi:hypothetical protein